MVHKKRPTIFRTTAGEMLEGFRMAGVGGRQKIRIALYPSSKEGVASKIVITPVNK